MSVIEQAQAEEVRPEPVARTATAAKMFKYSEFVDVGEGAQECEHRRDGNCVDAEHFHAWCRLANPFQETDIREKAQASKARRLRLLRDPDSDLAVVLDSELGALNDPIYQETILDELIAENWATDYLEAQDDMAEMEEFEHIEQDREEFSRLHEAEGSMPEEEQSDEYKRLREHVQSYLDAHRAKIEEREAPRREELRSRSFEGLYELLRNKRIEALATRASLDTYNAWTWFVGTYRVNLHETLGRPHLPMWEEIGHRDRPEAGTMFSESPEVLEALGSVYNELRVSSRQGSAGN